jgi:AAA+ superfamily predicted ATPase
LFLDRNEFDKAIDCYTRAIKEDPEYSSAYHNRALSYAHSRRYDKAAKDAQMVRKFEPESWDAPYLLGVLCERRNDCEGAIKWYVESLFKNANNVEARGALKRLERATHDADLVKSAISSIEDGDAEQSPESLAEIASLEVESPSLHWKERKETRTRRGSPQLKIGETRTVEGQIKGLAMYRSARKFEDVIGLDDVKEALRLTVVVPASRPDGVKRWKIEGGVSVLLYGPSGCGKTYIAECLAGEIDAFILYLQLNEVLDMYVGNEEKNIHTVFQQARDLISEGRTRCVVIFIDELDAIGLSRSFDSKESPCRRAIAQLLVELDGVEKNQEGVIVVGATNLPWDIDPALKRSGRFGDALYVGGPSLLERKSLFESYLRGIPLGDINYGKLARATKYCSPSDIKRIVRWAKCKVNEKEHKSGEETLMTTEDLMGAILSINTSTLYNWFADNKEKISSSSVDKTRYKPLMDDMERVLGTKSKPSQVSEKQVISAYT